MEIIVNKHLTEDIIYLINHGGYDQARRHIETALYEGDISSDEFSAAIHFMDLTKLMIKSTDELEKTGDIDAFNNASKEIFAYADSFDEDYVARYSDALADFAQTYQLILLAKNASDEADRVEEKVSDFVETGDLEKLIDSLFGGDNVKLPKPEHNVDKISQDNLDDDFAKLLGDLLGLAAFDDEDQEEPVTDTVEPDESIADVVEPEATMDKSEYEYLLQQVEDNEAYNLSIINVEDAIVDEFKVRGVSKVKNCEGAKYAFVTTQEENDEPTILVLFSLRGHENFVPIAAYHFSIYDQKYARLDMFFENEHDVKNSCHNPNELKKICANISNGIRVSANSMFEETTINRLKEYTDSSKLGLDLNDIYEVHEFTIRNTVIILENEDETVIDNLIVGDDVAELHGFIVITGDGKTFVINKFHSDGFIANIFNNLIKYDDRVEEIFRTSINMQIENARKTFC